MIGFQKKIDPKEYRNSQDFILILRGLIRKVESDIKLISNRHRDVKLKEYLDDEFKRHLFASKDVLKVDQNVKSIKPKEQIVRELSYKPGQPRVLGVLYEKGDEFRISPMQSSKNQILNILNAIISKLTSFVNNSQENLTLSPLIVILEGEIIKLRNLFNQQEISKHQVRAQYNRVDIKINDIIDELDTLPESKYNIDFFNDICSKGDNAKAAFEAIEMNFTDSHVAPDSADVKASPAHSVIQNALKHQRKFSSIAERIVNIDRAGALYLQDEYSALVAAIAKLDTHNDYQFGLRLPDNIEAMEKCINHFIEKLDRLLDGLPTDGPMIAKFIEEQNQFVQYVDSWSMQVKQLILMYAHTSNVVMNAPSDSVDNLSTLITGVSINEQQASAVAPDQAPTQDDVQAVEHLVDSQDDEPKEYILPYNLANSLDRKGNNVLHILLERGYIQSAIAISEFDQDIFKPLIPNNFGDTAFSFALQNNKFDYFIDILNDHVGQNAKKYTRMCEMSANVLHEALWAKLKVISTNDIWLSEKLRVAAAVYSIPLFATKETLSSECATQIYTKLNILKQTLIKAQSENPQELAKNLSHIDASLASLRKCFNPKHDKAYKEAAKKVKKMR